MNQKWERNSPKVRFTYNDQSDYYQSPVRPIPHQFSQSSIPRAASLPNKTISQYRPESQSHIKIVEDSFAKQRNRKHKIFENSPLVNRRSSSKSRIKQTVHGEIIANSPPKKPQKQEQSLHVQTIEVSNHNGKTLTLKDTLKNEDSKSKDLDINQLNRYIDRRLVQKFIELDSAKGDKRMKELVSNDELRKKDKQICYLKLQVQRLRRCEKLNKQNEDLYTRLVEKLKEYPNTNTKQLVTSTSKKIQSLANSPPTKNAQQNYQNIIINKRINGEMTQPLKSATAAYQLFISPGKAEDIQRAQQSGVSKAITFNNTKQTTRGRSHSKRLKLQVYSNLIETNQLLDQESFHNISEIPISNRLQEINNKLYRKMTRRSASKPQKDVSLSSTFYVNTVSTFYRTNPRYNKFMY